MAEVACGNPALSAQLSTALVTAMDDCSEYPLLQQEILDLIMEFLPRYALSNCMLSSSQLCYSARRQRFRHLAFDFHFEQPTVAGSDARMNDINKFLGILQLSLQVTTLVPIPRLVRSLALSFTDNHWLRNNGFLGYWTSISTIIDYLHGPEHGIRSLNIYMPEYVMMAHRSSVAYSWTAFPTPFEHSVRSLLHSSRLYHVGIYSTMDLPLELLHSTALTRLSLVNVAFDESDTGSDVSQDVPVADLAQLSISSSSQSGSMNAPYHSIQSLLLHNVMPYKRVDEILAANDGSLKELNLQDSANNPFPSLTPLDFLALKNLSRLTLLLDDSLIWGSFVPRKPIKEMSTSRCLHKILHLLSNVPKSGCLSLQELVISNIVVWTEYVPSSNLSMWHALDDLLTPEKCPMLEHIRLSIDIMYHEGARSMVQERYKSETLGEEEISALFPNVSSSARVRFTTVTSTNLIGDDWD